MSTDLIVSGEAELLKQQREAVANYGAGLPWNIDHYTALIRESFESAMHSFLRTGRLLLVARAHIGETGGEWQQFLSDVSIPRTTAWQMMRAAQTVDPEGRIQQQLPKSKVAELLSLSDADIKKLDAGDRVDGKDVDDIGNMTRAELRAWRAERDKQLEDLKLDLKTKDDLAGVYRAKIDRLETSLDKANRKRVKATPNEQITELQNSLNVLKQEVVYLLNAPPKDPPTNSLLAIGTELLDVGNAHGVDQSHYLAGIVFELMTKLKGVRDELILPILEEKTPPNDAAGEVR